MSDLVHIRQATQHDANILAELGARTFYDAFAMDNNPEDMTTYMAQAFHPGRITAALAKANVYFFLAEVNMQVVGYAKLHAHDGPASLLAKRPLELVRIYADQGWIGKGIGTALMRKCQEQALQNDHDVLWLGVWERNDRAVAFYRKWGFVNAGTHTFMLGQDAQTDLIMACPLKSSNF